MRGEPAACAPRAGRASSSRPWPFAPETRPAPQSIPFASRVRYLVALGACRRRTALGPGLLAAGPASNSTLLSIEPNASEFRYSCVGQPSSTALLATGHDAQPMERLRS